jgi:DNA polymerase III subunit epsilon
MRQIVLDTETTGLDPALGHRVIEIAGVELINRRLTGRRLHYYINPQRDSDEAALQIHGLTTEFLADKPQFHEIASEFVEFVNGAELIIHNAAFDIAFIDHELKLLNNDGTTSWCSSVIDTLKMAREMHPGKRNGLDTLCERYGINNSARTLHGALLDAQLLAEVYLAMTRGQESLMIEDETLQITITATRASEHAMPGIIVTADTEELQAHERLLSDIAKSGNGRCVWFYLHEREGDAALA